jgi:hypothetical protein
VRTVRISDVHYTDITDYTLDSIERTPSIIRPENLGNWWLPPYS